MCRIVVVQMGLIRYLKQWSIDPCGKTHMGCMWDPFGSLWATHKGYMVLNARKPVFKVGGGGGAKNKKGADQPALLLCLISSFVVRFLLSIIAKLTTGEMSHS